MDLTTKQTFTPLADDAGSGKKKLFFTFLNLQISTVL
jgi:hypothetical protein